MRGWRPALGQLGALHASIEDAVVRVGRNIRPSSSGPAADQHHGTS